MFLAGHPYFEVLVVIVCLVVGLLVLTASGYSDCEDRSIDW